MSDLVSVKRHKQGVTMLCHYQYGKRVARGVLAAVLLLTGCATRPISVRRVGQAEAYHVAMDSALTSGQPASDALIVLRRYGLEREYREDPDACLGELWLKALADGRRDAFFALSELCFLRAKRLDRSVLLFGDRDRARDTYLGAAIGAYLYLFGIRTDDPLPTAYDRRLRLACDLYNAALGRSR